MERTEQEIAHSLKIVDEGWKAYEKFLELEMMNASLFFLDAYHESGNNPSLMNLSAIQTVIGQEYDLYMINKEGIIEYTTYDVDLNLNLQQFPELFDFLTEIREGDQFVSDRITTETLTGKLRKYSYFPTSDHEYILELGLESEEFMQLTSTLNYSTISSDIVDVDPFITQIRFYDQLGYQLDVIDYQLDASVVKIVKNVYSTGKSQVFKNNSNDLLIKYYLVDLSDINYPTNVSKIVEITYNVHLNHLKLDKLIIQIIFVNLLVSSSIILIVIVMVLQFTSPISEIVQGVNLIAKGDLDYKIQSSSNMEMQSLIESINTMVVERKKIEDTLAKERSDLEKTVEDKQILLKEIHHRVKNNLQIISSLARLQKMKSGDPDLIQMNKDFQNRIQVMALIHEILYGSEDMELIDLSQYVNKLVAFLFRTFELQARNITLDIEIDQIYLNFDQGVLCGIIINEIITNAIKYAFPNEISSPKLIINISKIKFNSEDHLKLIIGDNGIGLPEEINREDIAQNSTNSLGIQLISGLVHQLSGKVKILNESGTIYEFLCRIEH